MPMIACVFFLFSLVFTFIFFHQSLFGFFVQDDFFLLNISQVQSLTDLLFLFRPIADVVWYRPLSSQIFFYLAQNTFGLFPFFWHLVVLFTHVLTSYFLFSWLKLLTRNTKLSFISALLYCLSQVHVVSLSWLAAYSFILGPLSFVITLLLYSRRRYFIAWIAFVGALGVTEMAMYLPIVLLCMHPSKDILTRLKNVTPHILSVCFILFVRFQLFPTQLHSLDYRLSISANTWATVKFYLYRLMGVPMLVDILPFSITILYILLLVISVLMLLRHVSEILLLRDSIQTWQLPLVLLFVLGVAPFILLSEHIAPHYLSFSLIGFMPLFVHSLLKTSQLFSRRMKRIGLLLFLTLYITGNTIGIWLTYKTHWIFSRARYAERLVVKNELKHTVGSEEFFSLGGLSAFDFFNNYSNLQ